MPNYKRLKGKGLTVFFTVVTYKRRPLFQEDNASECLRRCFDVTRSKYPFIQDAICVLPDHIHTIWTLPEDDNNYSLRWASIKSGFTRAYGKEHDDGYINRSRKDRRERGFWQRRFWEHVIRDEEDLTRHLEYIHYNPVKHGLANAPAEWKWSSFHEYVKNGYYLMNWNPYTREDAHDYGE